MSRQAGRWVGRCAGGWTGRFCPGAGKHRARDVSSLDLLCTTPCCAAKVEVQNVSCRHCWHHSSAVLPILCRSPPQLCRRRNASPELDLALQGVTDAKLFLCGGAVREGLPVEELVEQAAAEGISVLLPCGLGSSLGTAGAAAPELPL